MNHVALNHTIKLNEPNQFNRKLHDTVRHGHNLFKHLYLKCFKSNSTSRKFSRLRKYIKILRFIISYQVILSTGLKTELKVDYREVRKTNYK